MAYSILLARIPCLNLRKKFKSVRQSVTHQLSETKTRSH